MPGIVVPTNFSRASLASPPTGTGGLTFSVAAGKGALFPSPATGEWFYGMFTNAARSKFELVKVEARTTDSFTIATGGRGQDGTTADTWAAGDIFYLPTSRAMWLETAFSAIQLALAKLTPAADRIAYFTSANAAALADFTAHGRAIVASASAAATRTLLDVFSKAETWSTGDAKLTLKNVADTSWVMANDGSIGNAASGATTRANADTNALFNLIWTNIANAWAPVQDSLGNAVARGASAQADFDANRRLVLPKALGRAIAVSGTGSGLTARALGEFLGAENHQLTQAETPVKSHVHGVNDPGHAHGRGESTIQNLIGGSSGAFVRLNTQNADNTDSATTGISIQAAGDATATAHPNMQPTTFMNVMIKL